jgi:hypothetical protein
MNPQDRRAISTLRSCIESTTIYAINHSPASQRKAFSVESEKKKRQREKKADPQIRPFMRAFLVEEKFQRTVTRSIIVCIPEGRIG